MRLPARADIVIAGGGFAGAATAYQLARSGTCDVVVLEREEGFGFHASGRNAALGRQLVEDDRTTELTLRGAAFVRDPPRDFADAPLWRPVGSMLLADTDAQVDALSARAAARDIAHERISMAAARARAPHLEGAPGAGGIYVSGDGVIDVHALLMGYVRGARARGVRFALGREVVDVSRGSGAYPLRVRTSDGEIEARCAVAAGGAWAARVGALAGGRDPGLVPIRRHLFTTEPVAGLDADQPFVWHLGAREFYVRPEGGGFLLSACDEAASEPGRVAVAPDALEHLAETLALAAPQLAELGVARTWACQRTFAPDRRPLIGWDPDAAGLFWVAGLGGHGATASAAIGAEASAKILARIG